MNLFREVLRADEGKKVPQRGTAWMGPELDAAR